MNLERSLSPVLRYGSMTGVMIVAIGLLLYLLDMSIHENIIISGIAVIVLTPFAGLIVSFTSLATNKERSYAASVFILILMVIAGISIGHYVG